MALVVCAVIVALGTSLDALVKGVLLDPLGHPAEIIGSPQILNLSLWLSGLMLIVVLLGSSPAAKRRLPAIHRH